jgi:hypothetical protein
MYRIPSDEVARLLKSRIAGASDLKKRDFICSRYFKSPVRVMKTLRSWDKNLKLENLSVLRQAIDDASPRVFRLASRQILQLPSSNCSDARMEAHGMC